MNHCTRILAAAAAASLVIVSVLQAQGQEPLPTYKWTAATVDGVRAVVPAADKASVVAFVRPDQAQSQEAINQLSEVVSASGAPPSQVVVVVSGNRVADVARLKNEKTAGWLIVTDPDFTVSGTFGVHVWPTVVLVRSDGKQAGHLGGLNGAFKSDLHDYLSFAAGAIDEEALKKRLAEHEFVVDGPNQKADRHAIVAARMLDAGHAEQAAGIIAEGLTQKPDDAQLLLLQCRVMVARKQSGDAIAAMDRLPAGTAPAWQLAVLRGRALIDLERWDDARSALADAFKLNPRPAEAHYLLGRVYEHEAAWDKAAAEYRAAFESRASSGGAIDSGR